MRIAVLITCYNRVQTTVKALDHLFACAMPVGVCLDVFLVDDASPDRTGAVVQQRYPQIRVIEGTGNLFWCGGMRLAWDVAAKERAYDGFLWLNDDTLLYPDALQCLHQIAAIDRIIVGAVCDPDTRSVSYGFSGNPTRSPDGTVSPIRRDESINGNIVYIPRAVWLKVGGLRQCFTHGMGDTDYGLRARKAGVPIMLTPKFIGDCRANCLPKWRDKGMTVAQRWKLIHSPKGCPPSQYMRVAQGNHPLTWPLFLAKLYWHIFFP